MSRLSGAGRRPSRLRIVVSALCYYPERRTGSSRLAYDEARYLAGLGHEVWLVAMGDGTDGPEHLLDGPLHVLRYRRPRFAAVDPTDGHRRAVRATLERYVPHPVDFVHAHMPLTGAAAVDLYGDEARTCYSLHSPVRSELLAMRRGAGASERLRLRVAAALRSRLERRLLERSDVITCYSEFTRRLVARIHHPPLADRMKVVPGWVDLAKFQVLDNRAAARRALGWPVDRPVLFCLRRLVPRMGIDRLVAAASFLRRSGRAFRLVIGGTGPLRGELEAQARSLGVTDIVHLAGSIADEVLPQMYGAADASVLPSAELECFGLVAIETLACGRPVLATPVGAIPELVERAWLARDTSAEAIASLIGNFLDGRLPARDPGDLHASVERSYSESRRLPELVALALGDAPA